MTTKVKSKPERCAVCGGTLLATTITHTHPWGGDELYQLENVPAFVCQQCGHEWLSAETTQMIDEVIQKQQKPKRYQKVPVFDLAKA